MICHEFKTQAVVVNLFDAVHAARLRPLHTTGVAFGAQHIDNLARGIIAKQLPQRFLVIGDAVALHQLDEVELRIAGEGRAREMRILRQEVFCADVAIGEIAASAAGNADALADPGGVVNQQYTPPALPGLGGAHHAGGTGTDDDNVESNQLQYISRVSRNLTSGKRSCVMVRLTRLGAR